ncbi:hypothetical protein LUZ60_012640 [Juncus effusus]|nr:hypothetical protein LUZ60_012640 [Juncus effusus]
MQSPLSNKKPRHDLSPSPMSFLLGSEETARLGPEETARLPLPGYGSVPSSLTFSPDDRRIGFLLSPDESLNRSVFTFDPASRRQELVFGPPQGGGLDEGSLSVEERLRRERARERGLGVTRYEWRPRRGALAPRGGIMVPLPSGVYFQDLCGSEPELKLPSTGDSPIIDPHLSPDGNMIAFVQKDELHVHYLCDGETRQLTFGAGNGKTHGLAEYIAQEEMERKMGFWWAPDSQYIAFTEADASEIPLFRIMHQGKSTLGPEAQEDHPYPFAGESNAKVRLAVVPVRGGPIVWMDLLCGPQDQVQEENEDEYLARVNWVHDNTLTAQVLNRSHTKLKLLKFNIETGQKEVLLEEQNDVWVGLHDCFVPLDKTGNLNPGNSNSGFSASFIWASEKTGYKHLYLHDRNGTCLGPITEGNWTVEQIVGINETAGLVYFTGTTDGPLHTNLYRTSLFPNWDKPVPAPQRLTRGEGRHIVTLDHQFQKFIDIHDCLTSPPTISLCALNDGSLIMPIFEPNIDLPRIREMRDLGPEIVQIETKDGTVLYGALYLPDERKYGPPPYKTMVSVYGGPGVQLVADTWVNTVDMRAQFLRSKGILVWKLDNRGTTRRGLDFESQIKHKFGRADCEDQVAGVDWLVKQGLAKADHVGIYGWSYGGYLSAMCLVRFPDVFRCAVSGAPVTSWDGYDTFYTEKYMGLPSTNPDAYQYSSIMHHVHKLKGKLLLVHGMIDENVHFRHTARLINALIAARKSYELIVFPDERHMPRRMEDRVYMEERIWEFVERSL